MWHCPILFSVRACDIQQTFRHHTCKWKQDKLPQVLSAMIMNKGSVCIPVVGQTSNQQSKNMNSVGLANESPISFAQQKSAGPDYEYISILQVEPSQCSLPKLQPSFLPYKPAHDKMVLSQTCEPACSDHSPPT